METRRLRGPSERGRKRGRKGWEKEGDEWGEKKKRRNEQVKVLLILKTRDLREKMGPWISVKRR